MNQTTKSPYWSNGISHAGMRGKVNEDRYRITSYKLDGENALPVLLAVLSDGIGGHRAGEVAAELAVSHITELVGKSSGASPQSTLRTAIEQTSELIYEQSQSDGALEGMGATCACAWIIADRLYTANVGDSRIYLLRGSEILQLTNDHTWVQEAIDMGVLKPEQAFGHPNAHIIRRYLGAAQTPEVDLRLRTSPSIGMGGSSSAQGFSLIPGDLVMLCSDGLTDLVTDAEILTAYSKSAPNNAAENLVDLANQRGGHDNITIVTVSVPNLEKHIVQPAPPQRKLVLSCLGVILAGLVIGGLIFGGVNLLRSQQPTPTIMMHTARPSPQTTTIFGAAPTRTVVLPTATIQPLLPSPTMTLTPSVVPWITPSSQP